MQAKKTLIMFVLAMLLTAGISDIMGGSETSSFDIPAPEGLSIEKTDTDVILSWDEIDGVDGYKIYHTTDLYGSFPEDWEYYNTTSLQWIHDDVLTGTEDHFYMVRGLNGVVEGELSEVVFCAAVEFIYHSASQRKYYLSVPSDFPDMNGDDNLTASDLVIHIEGHTEDGSNTKISHVVKWDAEIGTYSEQYYYVEDPFSDNGWNGGTDFPIYPGDGIGFFVESNFTWYVNATETGDPIEFVYYGEANNKYYLSVPYTVTDYNYDGQLTSRDLVVAIEGDTGEGTNTKISKVMKWDAELGGYSERFYYEEDPFSGSGWYGTDFPISPGDGIGFFVESNFTWNPELIDLQPPAVINITPGTSIIPLDTEITLSFSRDMNRTSVEAALDWSDMTVELEWEDDRTLTITPQQPLTPGKEHNLTITPSAKDTVRNALDGSGDGIPGDVFVYTFTVELPPVIEHAPPERWHLEDNITLETEATDDIELDSVSLEYSYGENYGNVTMDNIENDTFTLTLTAPGTECILNYTIWGTDSSGLVSSENYTLPILNLTAPVVVNIWQEHEVMPMNGVLQLEFSKPMDLDIYSALTVTPDAEFELFWASTKHLNIQFYNLTEETEYTITLNSNLTTDVNGISMEEGVSYSFISQGRPTISLSDTSEEISKCSEIVVEAEILSDMEIAEVNLYYNDTNGEEHSLLANYSEGFWTATIPSQNLSGEIRYMFEAIDISGLKSYTDIHSIVVTNPTVIHPCQDIDAEAATPFEFTVRVTNPTGVRMVILHYNDGESTELTLRDGSPADGNWSTQLTVDEQIFEYQLEVVDWDGESIVLPNTPLSMEVGEQQSSAFGNIWLLLLIAVACAAGIGTIAWKKKGSTVSEDVPEAAAAPVTESPEEQVNNTTCTVCFGTIEGTPHRCSGCGNVYHRNCIQELGECPVCGTDPLKGGNDESP